MNDIQELLRLPSPAPRPQALAFDGRFLWMGSVETQRLYAIDPEHWTVAQEAKAPGKPWGMTAVGDEFRVLLGEGADDDRFIRRFIPGHGFREAVPAPDNTGSHLSYDGEFLYLSQWYNRRILELDDAYKVVREIPLQHQVCGQVISGGCFYLLTTDDEDANEYWLTKVDARADKPVSTDLARITFAARGLAFDGERFWTNHRENNEIVAFAKP